MTGGLIVSPSSSSSSSATWTLLEEHFRGNRGLSPALQLSVPPNHFLNDNSIFRDEETSSARLSDLSKVP